MSLSNLRETVTKRLSGILDALLRRLYLLVAIVAFNTVIVFVAITVFPYPINVIVGVTSITGSLMLATYYTTIRKLGGIVPVSDDLTFILVHMRCIVTSNPPLVTLFQKVGETDFYKKKYREIFSKVSTLTRNWGYSLPDALRLISKDTPTKVEEQLFQRFSAIVATGGDVKEYLRLEYNTLFSEYKSSYGRMVETLRVVLGVYTSLIGALTFLVATLMLLGMIFGGAIELVLTALIGMALALLGMSVLLHLVIRRPLFEYRKSRAGLVKIISITGIAGLAFLVLIFAHLVITQRIGELEYTSLSIALSGLAMLPAGILVKIYEGRIIEYDMFYPAFVRSYGEQFAIVPNLLESLKPLLIAELGKLKKLLAGVYAGLVNRIDPRVVWTRFAEESGSELVARATKIFVDTVELGGDTSEAGALLSDHVNEIFRLRLLYMQVFRTFEITLYVMHAVAIMLLIFIGGFMDIFMRVVSEYMVTIPPELSGLFAFFTFAQVNVSLLVNISSIILALSNTLALLSVNPGSKHAIYYYLSIMLLMTGVGVYVGNIAMSSLASAVFMPFT